MSTVGGKEGNHTESSGFSTIDDPTLSEQKTSAATESERPDVSAETVIQPKITTDSKISFIGDSGSTHNTIYHEAHDEIDSMNKFIQKSEVTVVTDKSVNSDGGDIAISLFNELDISEYSTDIQEYVTNVNRLATQPAAQPAA